MVWAFFPDLDWAKAVVVAVVIAFTLPPAVLFGLNLAFDLPIARGPALLACALVALPALLAGALRRRAVRNV